MADPNILSENESKKDTVRINLPPGMTTPSSKRDTSAMGVDQTKKETAMMGMPSEAKKETSRVAVPAAKPVASDMPRPTVRLRPSLAQVLQSRQPLLYRRHLRLAPKYPRCRARR